MHLYGCGGYDIWRWRFQWRLLQIHNAKKLLELFLPRLPTRRTNALAGHELIAVIRFVDNVPTMRQFFGQADFEGILGFVLSCLTLLDV